MNIDYHKFPIKNIMAFVHHYDEDKYWKRRDYVIHDGKNIIRKAYCLFYVKRCDAYNNASMGTDWNHGAEFRTPPKLPHGLNGIIISPDAKIGSNCTIFHQVTIGNDYKKIENVPVIGDNVIIFPGAKIVGKVIIGDNVKIGANTVVSKDIPSNTTVVSAETRTIIH